MACINHPTAPTAATCKSCGVDLCGLCTRFLDSGEYCEKCATVAEARQYMDSRSSMESRREQEVMRATSAQAEAQKGKEKERDKDRMYIWGGVGLATLMLFSSMGLYAFPNLFENDAVLAEQRYIMRLEECRQVFQAIGIILSEGQMPGDNLRCPGTSIPNVVTRQGNTVRVSHPNPGAYGLQALYVTSDSHRVVMEGGSSS